MRAALTLWQREVVRFCRQPSRVAGAIGSPLIFWALLGSGFGRSFQPAGAPAGSGYLEYFYPGILVLVVLFTAIFSTISIIEDRHEGFLQGVLVAPVPRTAIVAGKVLGSATLAALQAAALLVLGVAAGVAPASLPSLLEALGVLVLLAVGLSALGVLIAWRFDSIQGFHAVMNLGLVPLWLLSGAAFPASGAAGWVRGLMVVNPLTYGVAALRQVLTGTALPGEPALGASLAVVVMFGAAASAAAAALVSREASR